MLATGDLIQGADGLVVVRVGPWAKAKLDFIKRYCYVFNMGMKNKWKQRTYIDLFAGSGKCLIDKTNEELDGSALIALNCEVPFTHYFFNDMEARAIDALKKRTTSSGIASLQFFNNDCNEVVADIKAALPRQALHFCFIDPTNWQIRFNSIQILTDGMRMDLAITFHTGSIKRVASVAPKRLDDFYGDSSWRAKYEQMQSSGRHEGSRVLLGAYEEKLAALGYTDIQDRVLLTNTRGVPLYHLVFASKNPRGKDFWDKVSQKLPSGQIRLGL